MKTAVLIFVLISTSGFALAQRTSSAQSEEAQRLRRIILYSRHIGAHGMGYNEASLKTLSAKLTSTDIPLLIGLAEDTQLRVGAQFALASQCDDAIVPVKEAAAEHKISPLDAEDTLSLIESSGICTEVVRTRAAAAVSEIRAISEAEALQAQKQADINAAEDARIQANGLKMLDPVQSKTLTRQEREEVFQRSLKAMGLSQTNPLTPAQKDLIQRMYRTMVLGESATTRPAN